MQKLPRDFYNRNTINVAQDLLGKLLVHIDDGVEKIGRIIEVEAYLGQHDLACHASKGITPRTKIMFGAPGFAYVYLIYGIHHCINVVTEPEGNGSAVLIRALEPMQNITAKTNGPGLLCKAMNIDKNLNGHDLLSDTFYVADSNSTTFDVTSAPRIGIDYAGVWAKELLRFYVSGNKFVSRK